MRSRARFAAAMLAVATSGCAALLLTMAPAQAAAPAGMVVAGSAAAAQAPAGSPKLIVDPTSNLAADGATIKVQGTAFDNTKGLVVAICAADSGAPQDLAKCVGGAIPDSNTTSAWAHITEDGQGAGGVKQAWGTDGSFNVTLSLPSITAGQVNCVSGNCSLYAIYDDESRPQGVSPVALSFKAPASSSSSSSSAPPAPPSVAVVQSISSPSIVAGGTQKVIFSGFKPNEQVNLTLFSAPIVLSPVNADGTGVAQVQFVVPADLEAGAHRLEAIGAESKSVGVASFQVTAPVVSSSPPPSSSAPPSSSSVSSSASSASSSSVVSSSAPASSVVTSSSTVAPTNGDSGNSLWWLWLIIGIVLVAGIITAIVVYRRKQAEQRERDEQEVTDAAAREQAAYQNPAPGYGADAPTVFLPPVQTSGPPPGADPYGLLSGRDHPDNPTLYSGRDEAGPTEVLGPQGYQQGPGPYGQPLGYGGTERGFPATPGHPPTGAEGPAGPPTEAQPPATQAIPDASSGADGPGTQAWTPDLDDTDTGGAGGSGGGTDPAGPTGGGST